LFRWNPQALWEVLRWSWSEPEPSPRPPGQRRQRIEPSYIAPEHAGCIEPLQRFYMITRDAGFSPVIHLAQPLRRTAVTRARALRKFLDDPPRVRAHIERDDLGVRRALQ